MTKRTHLQVVTARNAKSLAKRQPIKPPRADADPVQHLQEVIDAVEALQPLNQRLIRAATTGDVVVAHGIALLLAKETKNALFLAARASAQLGQ